MTAFDWFLFALLWLGTGNAIIARDCANNNHRPNEWLAAVAWIIGSIFWPFIFELKRS